LNGVSLKDMTMMIGKIREKREIKIDVDDVERRTINL
jgi:hypothetical protein